MYQITAADIGKNTLYGKIKTISSGSLRDITTPGVYWLTSGVADKPEPGAGMYVVQVYSESYRVGTYTVADNNVQYTVSFSGNVWKYEKLAFYSNLTDITTLDASWVLSQEINTNSRIYAYKYAKILIVAGYLRSTSEDVPANITIAKVDGVSLKQQAFASPNSDLGETTRLVLMTNGQIRTEKIIKSANWFSFSFTALLN